MNALRLCLAPRLAHWALGASLLLSPAAARPKPEEAGWWPAGLRDRGAAYARAAAPLREAELGPPLDRALLRETSSLSSASFDRKMAASRGDIVLFVRSHPAAFHRDLARLAPSRIPGVEGLCLGDAHPDNFGFIRLGDTTRFVYNDLDDSGFCPIGVDAARYFTILRLMFPDPDLLRDVLERYVDVVKDPSRAVPVPAELAPDWDKVRDKGLRRHTSGDRLILGNGGDSDELTPASPAQRAAVLAALRAEPRLRSFEILDVAVLHRERGGSGGLRRYWLLARRGGQRTLLELKESAVPGVEAGRRSRVLGMEERLPLLTWAFWGAQPEDDYLYIQVEGTRFLVRDRLAKKSIDLDRLSPRERRALLLSQASLIARLHGPLWEGVKKDDLRAWLAGTSEVLAARWRLAGADLVK
jgi:hypothetical protein